MIRVFIENLILFLLPAALYIIWVVLMRPRSENQTTQAAAWQAIDDAPLLWLFVAGAVLILFTLIAVGTSDGGKPGQVYKPAAIENGKLTPDHFE